MKAAQPLNWFRPSDGSWNYDSNTYYSTGYGGLISLHTPYSGWDSATWSDANGQAHLLMVTATSLGTVNGVPTWRYDISDYTTASASWTLRASVQGGSATLKAAVIADHLYLVLSNRALLDCALPAVSCTQRDEVFTVARSAPQLAVVGTRLYAFGGTGTDGSVLRDVEAFDTATGQATQLPATLSRRSGFATAVLDGKIELIGGSADRRIGGQHCGARCRSLRAVAGRSGFLCLETGVTSSQAPRGRAPAGRRRGVQRSRTGPRNRRALVPSNRAGHDLARREQIFANEDRSPACRLGLLGFGYPCVVR